MSEQITNIPADSLQPQRKFNRPYMKFYVGDYLRDTQHLTPAEHGAYLKLLLAYWSRGGPLPNDRDYLFQVTGLRGRTANKSMSSVLNYFRQNGANLYHDRVEKELLSTYERSTKASQNRNARTTSHSQISKEGSKIVSKEVSIDVAVPEPERPRPPKNGSARKERGARIPENWEPSPDTYNWAVVHLGSGALADSAADHFRDHWLAVPGQRGVKTRWDLAYKNWCRNEVKWKGNGNGTSRPVSSKDEWSKRLQSLGATSGVLRPNSAGLLPERGSGGSGGVFGVGATGLGGLPFGPSAKGNSA